jgi:cytochrome oxidase Cu insertion factor (SCO1/SenC/PrrC family)
MAHWIIRLFLALLTLSSSSWAGTADPHGAFSALRTEAKPAPDFSLAQVNGKTVRLSDYRGNVVLLGFFKTF